uniref:Uncharacterized protein n=1 Tax=Plectus sambesii TaxID=2011161 RepID=A0A914UHR8_9BILA
LTAYPEAPPSFILNKDKVVEYDKEGKRHYIPKAMTRSISYEPSSNKPLGATECEVDSSDDVESTKSHSRTSSTGTNVLYQVRREELASGNAPSVKRMADAFNQIQKSGSNVATKRSIFGIRKSRSVETTDTGRHIGQIGRSVLPPGVSPAALPDSLQSSTESNLHLQHEESPFQRARNPLKGIGSRFVDHVRRSLSRGRRSASKEKEAKEPKKVSIKITKKSTKESAEKSLETGASSSGTSIGSTIPTNTGVDSDKLKRTKKKL